VIRELDELLELPANWDTYGGEPVDIRAASAAAQLLVNLLSNGVPPPRMVPTSEGGIRLEWYRSGLELQIDLVSEGPTLFYRDLVTQETWEGALGAEPVPLGYLLARISGP
jgi:hypothetical protein